MTYSGIFFALESEDVWQLHYHDLYCLFVIFGTNNDGSEIVECLHDLATVSSSIMNNTYGNNNEELFETNWPDQIDRIKTTQEDLIDTANYFGDVSKINLIIGMNEQDGICTICLEGSRLLTLLNVSIMLDSGTKMAIWQNLHLIFMNLDKRRRTRWKFHQLRKFIIFSILLSLSWLLYFDATQSVSVMANKHPTGKLRNR